MATSPMSEAIQHFRRSVLLREGTGRTDGQLLDDYISRRDEAALAALVCRHGQMVWGVCRRVLRNYHDVEDAFQATFLVLVRRAASIASRELLANWLYGVAHQTALKARATALRRSARERQVAEMPEPAAATAEIWHDLQPLLDEELSRLPDKYRAPLVLCDLEGITRKEAAVQLGCPEGTVAGRLARARTMLARRLTQRGVVLSGGVLAALLSQNAASAGVPASMVSSTIQAACCFGAAQAAAGVISIQVAALTEGVLKTMLLSKLKTVVAVLAVVTLLGGGTGLFTLRSLAGAKEEKAKDEVKAKADTAEKKVKSDKDHLQGEWAATSLEIDGKDSIKKTKGKEWKLVFDGDKVKGITKAGDEIPFKLDSKKKPKEIDLLEGEKEVTLRAIYELDGDTLKVCWLKDHSNRPTGFDSTNGVLAVFERKKKE
jgi:RNA polymerase sigma factor (sigma-70 family)